MFYMLLALAAAGWSLRVAGRQALGPRARSRDERMREIARAAQAGAMAFLSKDAAGPSLTVLDRGHGGGGARDGDAARVDPRATPGFARGASSSALIAEQHRATLVGRRHLCLRWRCPRRENSSPKP